MADRERLRLVLDLERGGDVPSGRVIVRGREHAFYGWTALATIIDAALGAAQTSNDDEQEHLT
ncbi:MAG: hypothetical protein JWQ48_3349 [Conexibacter sp.]|jgi:hypothetical protein|nr:hypothetical protein [Conexibacter sp.]